LTDVIMPRFVVLEHTWNGVHWDLMLERGLALRTWAVDAPIEPGREQTARSLADHRLAYLAYEGPVSGDRGEVRRWDEGDYDTIEWTASRIQIRIRGARLRSELTLRLQESGSATGAGGGEIWSLWMGNLD
jgi:DNA polymerase Ligase (LigD)